MRLLVAEDDPQLGDSLARGLRGRAYAVDLVVDGQEAVRRAALNTYDAMIIDVMLPKRDGFSVARTLRSQGVTAPILMLTARDAIADRVAGLDAGADDYLVKPFAFDELLARLRAITRRTSTIRAMILKIGPLSVDTRTQRVTRGETIIPLTAKEYALLEYLAQNEGTVVTRADITAHVWDDNHDPMSNTLEVYINRLRHKIDGASQVSFIQTRRGAGYALVAPATESTGGSE
jgi:two-component system copper resistance phosphate regulon response regulator CusR